MNNPTIAVTTTIDEFLPQTQKLAMQLKLPLTNESNADYDFLLLMTESGLELKSVRHKREKSIRVDFYTNQLIHRRKYSGGNKQLIAKAVGIKPKKTLTVLDATAGLGTDAFMLANLGCNIVMLERSAIIGALLADGLKRAYTHPDFHNLKMTLIETDAISYLDNTINNNRPLSKLAYPEEVKEGSERKTGVYTLVHKDLSTEPTHKLSEEVEFQKRSNIDVIYLDPMYPHRSKSALNKKEMRFLRLLVGDDTDAEKLLASALCCATDRVVVKRPRLAPSIGTTIPTIQFIGKSSRYDVYLTHRMTKLF